MFFILSKILAFLLSPLLWSVALLLIAFKLKEPQKRLRLRLSAILILYLASNSFVVDELFRMYEPVTRDEDLLNTKYTGAIVLGGIGDIDLRLQKINFGYSADRLFQILPYYHSGRIEKIIFTGGSGRIEFPDKKEGYFVKKYLNSINIPDSALVIEQESKNTYENAVLTKKILDSLGLKGNYLLVTSAYHMPRAMAVFKKAGFENLSPYITNKISGVRRFTPDHLLIPNPDALFSLQFLIHEWMGFIVYKLKGYA